MSKAWEPFRNRYKKPVNAGKCQVEGCNHEGRLVRGKCRKHYGLEKRNKRKVIF